MKQGNDNSVGIRIKPVIQVMARFAGRNRLAFACLIFAAVVEPLSPFINVVLLGKLLDAIREGADFTQPAGYIFGALGLQFFCQTADTAARQCFNQKNEYQKEIEGSWLNHKAFTMDYEYLEDAHVQELRARGEKTWQGVAGWTLYTFEKLLSASVGILASAAVLLPLFLGGGGSDLSFVPSVLLIAATCFLVWVSYRKSASYSRKIQETYNGLDKVGNRERYYQDILASSESQKDLRIFGQQKTILKDMDLMIKEYWGEIWRLSKLFMKMAAVDQSVSDFSGLLVYLFTSIHAFFGLITVGQAVTYAASIIRLSEAVTQFAVYMGSVEQVFLLCADQKEYMELGRRKYKGSIPLEKRRDNKFKVQFNHVSFRYPGTDAYVIKDLNLNFVIGERMAVVGKNGSGKSTFIKLLCRLYDVTEGCIKVNDVDIRKYDDQEYYRLFSVVFQDYRMFAIPLGENIAASRAVDEERALDALARAGLRERVQGLPEGLDTYIGKDFHDSGVAFSGGEKQKMAIARAIYKDAPFVIMDEPTAALDPESECEVYAGFDRMVGNKTAIYISHRLASCRFCHDILVFDNGNVVQRGSHEELAGQEGLYRELWEAQAQYYTES